MIFLIVAAALVAGAPLVAAVLVSVASVREDAAKSLAGLPPGLFAAAARRLLRAGVGDVRPLQRPLRASVRLPHALVFGQRRRASRTGPVLLSAPRLPADNGEPGLLPPADPAKLAHR